MPQDKSSSAVAKGLKMTKFGSNAATVVEKAKGTNPIFHTKLAFLRGF